MICVNAERGFQETPNGTILNDFYVQSGKYVAPSVRLHVGLRSTVASIWSQRALWAIDSLGG